MQDDNRENKIKVKNNFECEEAYATEEYAEQTKRIKAERPLSSCEKEDIFMVRWITQAFIGMIICLICSIFVQIVHNDIFIIVMIIQAFIYPIFYWRKELKDSCKCWWNLLHGRRA